MAHRPMQQQTCLHHYAASFCCAGCCLKQNKPSTLTPCFDIFSRSGCCSLRCISQREEQHSPATSFDFSQSRLKWVVQAANQALSSDQPCLRSVCTEICSCTLQACKWSPSHARLPQVQANTFWNEMLVVLVKYATLTVLWWQLPAMLTEGTPACLSRSYKSLRSSFPGQTRPRCCKRRFSVET